MSDGLVVYIIIGINVTIEWIGEWQQQGHLSKLQIKERYSWFEAKPMDNSQQ